MPGNVVMGSHSYANEILTGASGHDIRAVHRMSTNVLSCYLLISERKSEIGQCGSEQFSFLYWIETVVEKQVLILYLKQIYPITPRSG